MIIVISFLAIIVLGTILCSLLITDPSIWYMWLMWFGISILAAIICLVIFLLILIPIFRISKKPQAKYKHFIERQVIWMVNRCFLNIRLHVHNRELIDPNQTYLLVGNHKSIADATTTYEAYPYPNTFIGKKEVEKLPYIKLFYDSLGVILVNRENDREALRSIVEATKLVGTGYSLLVFPEGGIKTRETELMVDIKPGCYRIAQKNRVPILPMAMTGNSQIGKNAPWKKTVVDIYFLPPIMPSEYEGLNTTEIGQIVFDRVNEELRRHGKN